MDIPSALPVRALLLLPNQQHQLSEPRSPHYCDAIIWQHCSISTPGRDSALLCHPQVHKQYNRVVYYARWHKSIAQCPGKFIDSSPETLNAYDSLGNDPRAHVDCAEHHTISYAREQELSAGRLGG